MSHIKQYRCLSLNRQKWIFASFSISAGITAKSELVFVFNTGELYFYLKANKRRIDSSKKRYYRFFMWKSLEILNAFNTSTSNQIFWKRLTFFTKLESRFWVQSTKIEKATFPYKIALSEANVKANRMGSTKWTFHKKRSLASNYFIFWKILFPFKNPV